MQLVTRYQDNLIQILTEEECDWQSKFIGPITDMVEYIDMVVYFSSVVKPYIMNICMLYHKYLLYHLTVTS